MKLYKSLLFLATVALSGAMTIGCSDDDTLSKAKEVYIDISPEEISLTVGDTINISATVSNTSGKIINTPVEWSLDDESVVVLLGDTALTCVTGALDRGNTTLYTTKLRATLTNGKYAVATVSVQPKRPDGVAPEEETHDSYNMDEDMVWFTVTPKIILEDYVPEVELSNDNITLLDPALEIEKEEGRVGVRFSSGLTAGECDITLSVGEGMNLMSGVCKIILKPFIESSIWDPGTGTGPNDVPIPRMLMGQLEQYRTFAITKTIDINSTSYAYVGVNVPGGDEYQIRQAMDYCKWEAVSGNSVLVTQMSNEFIEFTGYDAILRVASGAMEGTTVFNYVAADTTLEVTFRVIDFQKQPVDRITTNAPEEGIEMVVGGTFDLETGVEPLTSFTYHRPVVTAEDPSIVKVGEYSVNALTLTGLKEGSTNLVLTANDKTLTIPVTVKDGVSTVVFDQNNTTAAFVGQTITWNAIVTTSTGKTSTFPITWSSSNESVATAAAGANPAVNGVITAKAAGSTTITATVLDKKADASLQVVAVPASTTYTKANTTGVVLGEAPGNDMRISLTGPSGEKVEVLLLGYKGQWGFDVTDMSKVVVTYNGVKITPDSGWVKSVDMETYSILSFELNFNIGGATFTLKATDLEG